MRIYACGCSFTYGDELVNPNVSAWPVLLANNLKSSVVNDAVSGGTNQRTVYQTIKNSKDNYDLYLIAWTEYSRYTFHKADNNFEVNFNVQLKNNLYSNAPEFKDFGTLLYKHWHNELYAFKYWLQQIIQLQAILKNKNYLMINTMHNNLNNWLAPKDQFVDSVKSLINFDIMNDEQIFAEYDEIKNYVENIDTSTFYQWGDFYISQLCRVFPVGKQGHILEQGHSHIAGVICNHLRYDKDF